MLNEHERSDANAKKIMWVAIASVVIGAIILLGLVFAFSLLRSNIEAEALKVVPKELIDKRKGPPPPLLEVSPIKVAQESRERERQLLQTYGWVDRENGIVRVPIEKAIEILLYEQR
ncbi:MAG TPA: hypothetical protein VEL47_04830 [Myxococcota bacterium]|nr:hypothetical protein [Myxococcota bacterium]